MHTSFNEPTQAQYNEIDRILTGNFDPNAFMQPVITNCQTWYVIETDKGETYVEHMANPILDNESDLFFEGGIAHAGQYTVDMVQQYGAQLSAPGYMDQTEWILGDDPVALAQTLADMYGEPQENDDEPDDDEPSAEPAPTVDPYEGLSTEERAQIDAEPDNVRFFFENAGWSFHPSTETAFAGRLRCARASAEIERDAKGLGWFLECEPDGETYAWHGTKGGPDECFDVVTRRSVTQNDERFDEYVVTLHGYASDDDEEPTILATLAGVTFADNDPSRDPYKRVLFAELASDAFAERDRADKARETQINGILNGKGSAEA